MDLNLEEPTLSSDEATELIKLKKRCNEKTETEEVASKKIKISETQAAVEYISKDEPTFSGKPKSKPIKSGSPKKRLELTTKISEENNSREKFIYGNYSQYYGYRNEDFHDIRLDVFAEHSEIFRDQRVLDIGCNNGFITMEVAKQFEVKSIVGLDIDKSLINQAIKTLTKCKKSLPMDNDLKRLNKFPFNTTFVHGNYVLKNDVLLEIETTQFDVILCLSITKWIHLNFGDNGLKQAFRRMFLQLKPQGKLILEPQSFDNYGRRKKMTDTIFNNYKNMKFLPKDFTQYLLSPEVGFYKMESMGVPDHCKKGFKRPLQIFFKN